MPYVTDPLDDSRTHIGGNGRDAAAAAALRRPR